MYFIILILFILLYWSLGNSLYRKGNVVKKRIEIFIPEDVRNNKDIVDLPNKKEENKTVKHIILRLTTFINPKQRKRDKLQQELDTAGIPLKPEEFILTRIFLSIILGVLTFIFQINVYICILLIVIGLIIPNMYLKMKKEKRLIKCASQLPQTLDTMATAMKSGFSFIQAMQIIGKEVPDPLGPEFSRTIREINLGVSMEVAFENMMKRLPNKDLDIVVTALLIQRTTGGNLAQILETIKDTITERVRMKEELKALTAQGKMSAWVISLLPVILGLLLNVMNPEYFSPLLTHPLGWALLAGGTISGLIGWVFIQKIIRIEV